MKRFSINNRMRQDAVLSTVVLHSGLLQGADIIALAASVIQGILVARYLGPESYGILIMITVYTNTIHKLIDTRIWETVIRFVIQFRQSGEYQKAKAVVKLCYGINAMTSLTAFIIVFFTASLAAGLLIKNDSAASLVRLYAFSVLAAIPIDTSMALLRVADRYGWLAGQKLVICTARLVAVVAVLFMGMGIQAILWIYLTEVAINGLSLLALSYQANRTLQIQEWWNASLSSLMDEGGRIFGFLTAMKMDVLFKLLQRNADTLLIGSWLTTTEAGYFRLARSITDLIAFPISPMYTVSYPEFNRFWQQRNFMALARLVRQLTFIAAVVAVVAVSGIFLAGDSLLTLTVGNAYLPALPILQWLAVGVGIAVATTFAHPLLLAMDRPRASATANGVGVVVQLLMLVILLPIVGAVAGGMAYVGFYLVWVFVAGLAIRNAWQQKEFDSFLANNADKRGNF